ncbi:MAG: hypothetical protein DSY40_02410 [Nautilia sp.]|nr:MAG: hypothetical protein DSY40_02410 [Nautilia sp.]
MKKLLFSALVVASSFAYETVSVMPYASIIDYSGGTDKKVGKLAGVYISDYKNNKKVEIDVEHSLFQYPDSARKYNQTDATLIFNNYQYGQNEKIGIHNIWTYSKTKNYYGEYVKDRGYSYTLIAGYNYYKVPKVNYGANIYFSKYENGNVYQVTPKAGYTIYKPNIGTVYLESSVDYIRITKGLNTRKNNFTDLNIKIQNFNKYATISLEDSFGRRMYKVANDGFVVYNLADEYKNRVSLSVSRKIVNNTIVKLEFSHTKFLHNNENAQANGYVLSFLKTF